MMNEKEIHLRDYLRIIKKRKGSIFTFFILTLLIVIIATFTATPFYFAATKVLIERNTTAALTSGARYTPYDPEFIETHNQLIMSSAVVEKAVKSLNPEKIYDTFFTKKEEEKNSYISSITGWIKDQYVSFKEMIGIEKLASDSTDKDIVEKLIPDKPDVPLAKAKILEDIIKNNISVSPVENSRILQIGYMSDSPVVAVQVANAIAQAYIDELVDMQMEVSGYSIGWMKKKAEIQRANLEESEKELYEYKKKHDIVMVEDKITVLPERLSDLSRQLTVSETKRILHEIKYQYKELTIINHWERSRIAYKVLGEYVAIGSGEQKISTGIFAALIAFYLGANPVILSGFSFSANGHAYNTFKHKRNHISADKTALLLARKKGLPFYASDSKFSLESGLPEWKV